MIHFNNFITWEMFLNKHLLSKIYFLNRLFVRAIFLVYILFVIICPSTLLFNFPKFLCYLRIILFWSIRIASHSRGR